MIHCALILMVSLPAVWLVVVIGLIVITVASSLLCVLKWREAAMLKKEVLELRDTMRMMRYEEANLSRMLHTVEKSEEFGAPSVEESAISTSMSEEQVAEEPITEEETETAEVSAVEETVSGNPVMEQPLSDDSFVADEPEVEVSVVEVSVVETPVMEESVVEEPVVDIPCVVSAVAVEEPVMTKPRKQAINERRPAIPNDLFAAWFEENASVESKEPEIVAASEEVIEKVAGVAQEEQVEVPVIAAVATEVPDEMTVIEITTRDGGEQQIVEEAKDKGAIELSKEDERFCRKLERIVNARMRNPNLNIDVIASQFGIGRTNFYRKVRELMDISPNDYLRKCRMERAAELLRSTEMNIAEVCAQVGIPDAQYFSRVFKAHFGMPPSAYREQK